MCASLLTDLEKYELKLDINFQPSLISNTRARTASNSSDDKLMADLYESKYLSASENLHCARNAENVLM